MILAALIAGCGGVEERLSAPDYKMLTEENLGGEYMNVKHGYVERMKEIVRIEADGTDATILNFCSKEQDCQSENLEGLAYIAKNEDGARWLVQNASPAATASASASPAPPEPSEMRAIGEAQDNKVFSFRALSVTETTSWFYPETMDNGASRAESFAGRFIAVWFSIENTGTAALALDEVVYTLTADTGERFGTSDSAACPRTSYGTISELQPREMLVGCAVFDTPSDVESKFLDVAFSSPNYPAIPVDLRDPLPEGVTPPEVLALQYELNNAQFFEESYDLFASESKAQITLEQFTAASRIGFRRFAIQEYAFTNLEINGDRAVLDRVFTVFDSKNYATTQDRATQEFTREDDMWHVIARPEQINYFQSQVSA